jgi:hypothetical protein
MRLKNCLKGDIYRIEFIGDYYIDYMYLDRNMFGMIFLNNVTKDIELVTEFEDVLNVTYLGNYFKIFGTIDFSQYKQDQPVVYEWLGFKYNNLNILINLYTTAIELNAYPADDWIYLYTEDTTDENIIEFSYGKDLKFIINLMTMQITCIDGDDKIVIEDYLLGKEDEFVFDKDNNLVLSSDN